MERRTGIVRDDRYLRHGEGFYHPESPERLEAIYAMLDGPDMKGRFVPLPARHADHDEIALVHDRTYIDFIASTAKMNYYSLDPDTQTTPESYDTAKLAVGGLLNALDAVMAAEVDNAMALVRPPGHHASRHRAAGFCIFNNIAIAARYALSRHGLKRILIVDWDLHHGDGTQEIFYGDNKVLYFSVHQYPAYPGTGGVRELGSGEGKGYTINVPLKARSDDAVYVRAFTGLLKPVALSFRPELILLSAGFDSYHMDPLGDMRVTEDGYAAMTRILLDIADASCRGRLVGVLEGGYHKGGVTSSVRAVLREMAGLQTFPSAEIARLEGEAAGEKEAVIRRVREEITPLWRVF